jgi:UV excision repair protein RAD23
LVTGAAYEEAIAGIVEMGFAREDAIRALRASFNNPDRAVEYLTNGFPATEELAMEDDEDVEATTAVAEMDEDDEEFEGEEGGEPMTAGERSAALDFLRQDPQFLQLRALIQQNPQLLEPIIEQLGQSSPELFQLIQNHQEEFAQLMNESAFGEGSASSSGSQGMHRIQLTEEEVAAIDRLVALGFDKNKVIEAYLACDKNEELAANFLLEHLGDDDF